MCHVLLPVTVVLYNALTVAAGICLSIVCYRLWRVSVCMSELGDSASVDTTITQVVDQFHRSVTSLCNVQYIVFSLSVCPSVHVSACLTDIPYSTLGTLCRCEYVRLLWRVITTQWRCQSRLQVELLARSCHPAVSDGLLSSRLRRCTTATSSFASRRLLDVPHFRSSSFASCCLSA